MKLVDNEEPIKTLPTPNNFDIGGPVQPPPNLAPILNDEWFYQDPQVFNKSNQHIGTI